MAWLFGDSFDHYTTAQITRKWNKHDQTFRGAIAATGRNNSNAYMMPAPANGGTDCDAGWIERPSIIRHPPGTSRFRAAPCK